MAAYESLHTLLLKKHKDLVKPNEDAKAGEYKARVDNILGQPMMLAASSTSVVRYASTQ